MGEGGEVCEGIEFDWKNLFSYRTGRLYSKKGAPALLFFLAGFGSMPLLTKTFLMVASLLPSFNFLSTVINALAASSKLAFGVSKKWCAITSLSLIILPS